MSEPGASDRLTVGVPADDLSQAWERAVPGFTAWARAPMYDSRV